MDDGAGLGDIIAAAFAAWAGPYLGVSLDRERSIYGAADPHEIALVVDCFCVDVLGARIDKALFFASSQADVSGLRLTDGRRVVVKAHPPAWSADFLTAVVRIQRRLADRGFPCPRPLLAPTRLGHGYATVEELVDDGAYADAHEPFTRRAMAVTLALLIRLADDLHDVAGLRAGSPMRQASVDAIWPLPHHPMFDIAATEAGAEWIDRLAAGAKETLARGHGAVVVGHTDWSAQNFLFANGLVRAVYDWDSLVVDRETAIVGQATTFPMDWRRKEPPVAPSQDEARAFVAEYEQARGAPFTTAEWEGLAAAATYALAYGARLEHSLDPTRTDFIPGSARWRLARYGDAFLRLIGPE